MISVATQLELAPSVAALHKMNGERIRGLLRRALEHNGISRSDLAHETDTDNSQLTKILDDPGANIPPKIIVAVMAKDRLCVLLDGLADMVGRETQPKSVDLAAENKALRGKLAALRSEIDSLLES